MEDDKTTSLNIVGVPEHFNLPWRLVAEKQSALGLPSFNWMENPSGTGAMCQQLRSGAVDLAVLLTEGAVKEAAQNPNIRLISFYVMSPLIWGIHASSNISIDLRKKLINNRFAISRFSSGSHLMACLYSNQKGHQLRAEDFQVVNNLEGARVAMRRDSDLIFLWEKFMTRYLVESGEMVRIDEYPAPWPAFTIACSQSAWKREEAGIRQIIEAVLSEAQVLKHNRLAVDLLCDHYRISERDASSWLATVEWSREIFMDTASLSAIHNNLQSVGVLS